MIPLRISCENLGTVPGKYGSYPVWDHWRPHLLTDIFERRDIGDVVKEYRRSLFLQSREVAGLAESVMKSLENDLHPVEPDIAFMNAYEALIGRSWEFHIGGTTGIRFLDRLASEAVLADQVDSIESIARERMEGGALASGQAYVVGLAAHNLAYVKRNGLSAIANNLAVNCGWVGKIEEERRGVEPRFPRTVENWEDVRASPDADDILVFAGTWMMNEAYKDCYWANALLSIDNYEVKGGKKAASLAIRKIDTIMEKLPESLCAREDKELYKRELAEKFEL